MNPYRQLEASETRPKLSFDYTAEVDRQRSRVLRNSVVYTLAVGSLLGIVPFVFDLFGVITLAMAAVIGVTLAIRCSQTPASAEIEAYEKKLLRKRTSGTGKRRRRSRHRRCPMKTQKHFEGAPSFRENE